MRDWKINQELYHRLNTEYTDDLNKIDIVITENIKEDALRHFVEYVDEWIYPAKSYVVAFCYAYWISQEFFNENFYDLLNDPELLYGNDPYFKPYNEDPDTYNYLMEHVEFPIPMKGMVPDIREYYNAEIRNQ